MDAEASTQLSAELVASLSRRGDLREFPRGELIIHEGDQSDALYILVSGEVRVFTRDGRGRELVYNILQPGEFFGELFLDGGPRSASARAATDAQCVVVGPDAFRGFMREYPEFAECLVMKLIARVRHATQQTRSLALSGVHERTVALLNRLAVVENGERLLPPAVTQQEIADRIGASREMVNHVLRDLARGGWLTRRKDRRMVLAAELPKQL